MGPLWLLPGGLCVCVSEYVHMYVCVCFIDLGRGKECCGGVVVWRDLYD